MTNLKDSNSQRADRVKKLGWLVAIIILLVVIADQWLKIWVKTNFYMGEELDILPWFKLKFIENNGFAFGIEWLNKYVLTFGRILAVVLFIWAMRKLLRLTRNNEVTYQTDDKKDETSSTVSYHLSTGFFVAFALIIAGAAGNIFDCVFYGEIFTNPYPPEIAQIFPVHGYAGWFEGRVVDMLYFPLFNIEVGGIHYEFFQYIFNIADSAITVGVLLLLFFFSKDAAIALNSIFEKRK
ncbi:MAG: signal peptidase II [Muribaculaceae bacterium]|nr:signal peptidase II [Muribaculaceae bacterium]